MDFPELPQRLPVRGQNLLAVDPLDQRRQNQPQVRAGRQALRAGVGRQARFDQQSDQFVEPVGEQVGVADRHRGQPHDRAVAAGPLRGVARGLGIAGLLETAQGAAGRDADVEAAVVDRVLPFSPPGDVAAGLVVEIPADAGDAVGQGQRHAGVVGPFAGGQAVRAAATVAGHLGEGARRLELDGGTKGIADGEAEEGSTLAINREHSKVPSHVCQ